MISPWDRCTENNYPDDDKMYFIAIYINDEWQYYTKDSCPYGWNVLCKSDHSYWMYPPDFD